MHRPIRGGLILLWLAAGLARPLPAAPEHWTKVESPFFTIYSEASVKKTKDWAVEFEQFRRTMSELMQTAPTRLPPALVVMFRSESAMRPFKPLNKDGRVMEVNGFTVNSPIVTTISLSFEGDQEQIRHGIFFGGTSWFLDGFAEPGPAWLRTGLAEVFSTFDIDGEKIAVGRHQQQHAVQLARGGTMSMDKLFGIDPHKDLPYRNDELTRTYHAQAWAFTHYLLFGRGTGGAERLGNYLKLLQFTMPDRAFEQAFGTGPESMEEQLREYIRNGRYAFQKLKFDRAAVEKTVTLQPATETEVMVAKGYVLLLNESRDAARDYFVRARTAAPADPKPLEALGDLADLAGDRDEAARQYERALELGSRNFRPYFQLAEWALESLLVSDRAELPPAAARRAANQLERAVNLNPYYLRSYESLATALLYVDKVTDEDPKFLDQGLQSLPHDAGLETAQAALWLKAGQTAAARERLAALAAPDRPMTAATRGQVRRLQAQMEWNDGLGQLEKLLADKKGEEAERLGTRLLRADMPAEQRVKLNAYRTQVGEIQTLASIEQAIAGGRWADAEILAQPLAEEASVPAVQAQARALLEQIKPHTRH